MQHQIHPNKIRQVLLVAVLIILGALLLHNLSFLLIPFLGAITFYVLLRNYYYKLVIHWKWRKQWAAAALLFSSFVLVIAPFAWLLNFGFQKIQPVIEHPSLVRDKYAQIVTYIHNKLHITIASDEILQKINPTAIKLFQGILTGTLESFGILAMMYVLLYFMLVQSTDMEKGLRKFLPFKDKNKKEIILQLRNLIFSNAIGIPIVAIVQGAVGALGYWIFGADDPLLLGLLTAIASVIPVVGCMLVYVPLMLYTLSTGHTWQGIALGIWGFGVIGSVDNIARFILQKKLSNTHPLVTIFGVFLGLNIFGFVGIIFGPILVALFVLLLKIYVDEYGVIDADDAHLPSAKNKLY